MLNLLKSNGRKEMNIKITLGRDNFEVSFHSEAEAKQAFLDAVKVVVSHLDVSGQAPSVVTLGHEATLADVKARGGKVDPSIIKKVEPKPAVLIEVPAKTPKPVPQSKIVKPGLISHKGTTVYEDSDEGVASVVAEALKKSLEEAKASQPTQEERKILVLVKCEHCGSKFFVFIPESQKEVTCRCGGTTIVKDLTKARFDCECGYTCFYHSIGHVPQVKCKNCGKVHNMEYDDEKGMYSPV